MNKDNPALRDALNGAIKAIRADGTYDAIQKKYFSFDIYGGFVNGMVASHLLCHSGTINRHSLNGALLS